MENSSYSQSHPHYLFLPNGFQDFRLKYLDNSICTPQSECLSKQHTSGRKSWGALLAALRDGAALRQPISRKGPSINEVPTEEGRRDGPKANNSCDKCCECEHQWMVPKCDVSFSACCDSATCSTYGVVLSGLLSPVVNGVVTGNKRGGKIPMAPMCWAQMLSKIQPRTVKRGREPTPL